ncbi:MAG TPA: transporter, partial [Gammaproteobacteria bacterium]|nr:transporter [Gammaproteobacteria bacterium]
MKTLLFICLLLAVCFSLYGCAPVIVAGTVAGAGVTVAADRRSPDKIIEDEAIEIQATDYIYSNPKFGKEVHVS